MSKIKFWFSYIISSFQIWAAFLAQFMCHHALWSISVSHLLPFLNIFLSWQRKASPENTILIFGLILNSLLFQIALLIFFAIPTISHYSLLLGLLFQHVALLVNGCRFAISNDRVKLMAALIFCGFFICFLTIVTWRLWRRTMFPVYIDYNSIYYIDYIDLDVWCPRKAIKLNHSVHHC